MTINIKNIFISMGLSDCLPDPYFFLYHLFRHLCDGTCWGWQWQAPIIHVVHFQKG